MFNFLLPILAGGSATAAAVAGGAALVGSALTQKQARKERRNHFRNLAASAQAGGFNPLSVLNATGGGGYGTYAGILSRSPMEAGLNAAAGSYADTSSQKRMMRHEVNLQTMRQTHEAKLTRMSNDAFSKSQEDLTSIKFGGVDTKPNAAFSDVELAEQRYGDIVSIPIGLGVAAGDIYSTAMNAFEGSSLFQGALTRAESFPKKNGIPQVPGFTWKNQMPEGWNFNPRNTSPANTSGMKWVKPRNPNALRIEVPLGQ